MNGVNGHFPQFQPSALNAPIARPVATPRNVPHEFMTPKRAPPDTNGVAASARYGAGFIGPDPMHRITMSLKSGLSSEIEFALSYLVRVSFEYGDRLLVDAYPGLPELLFAKVQSVEKLVHEFHMQGQRDNVDHATFTRHLEKINEAALVLRNMSFQPDNAKAFAALHYPKDIIVMGLSLSNHANLIELKQYLLDVVETMANDLPFTQQDPLFDVLCPGLLSDDRGLLLGSLRAICRLLVGRDEYNRVSEISDAAILRIQSLLMVEDEELVSACLDFLYQYTSNDENVDKLLEPPSGIELMKHLVRLLLFQGITGEQIVYLKNVRKAPVQNREIPQLPQEIVNDLLGYTEPERATKWMRCCFENDPESDITQIALWQAYQARFNEYVSTGLPLLPAAEFIKNVSVAFSSASAMVLPSNQGQKFIIKGIRPRETPMSLKGVVYLACKWYNTPGDATSRCKSQVATPQDLWAHTLEAHLAPPPPPASVDAAPNTTSTSTAAAAAAAPSPSSLVCNWNNCKRFPPPGDSNRLRVVSHVRTHMPNPARNFRLPAVDPDMPEEPDSKVIIRRCETNRDDRGDAAGIPLIAALVLRNLSRRGNGSREMMELRKEELYEVMAVNKPIAPYITDLLLEMEVRDYEA